MYSLETWMRGLLWSWVGVDMNEYSCDRPVVELW